MDAKYVVSPSKDVTRLAHNLLISGRSTLWVVTEPGISHRCLGDLGESVVEPTLAIGRQG